MKSVACAALAALMLMAGAASAGDTVPKPRYVTSGKWTWPDQDQVNAAYPARARHDNVDGYATIECDVTAAGTLEACVVIAEGPAGYGFGQAAIEVFGAYAHVDPATVEGGIRPGDRRRLSLRWFLG